MKEKLFDKATAYLTSHKVTQTRLSHKCIKLVFLCTFFWHLKGLFGNFRAFIKSFHVPKRSFTFLLLQRQQILPNIKNMAEKFIKLHLKISFSYLLQFISYLLVTYSCCYFILGSYGSDYILDISSISFSCSKLKSAAQSYNALWVALAC